MILIHPPIAKPSEPPAGLAKLSGALTAHGVKHILVDANLEGILYLLDRTPYQTSDTWTTRAAKSCSRNLAAIRDSRLYESMARYRRAVSDVNHLLNTSGGASCRISLADYEDGDLSPQRSADLIRSAEQFEKNPFYPYFRSRFSDLMERENPRIIGVSISYLSQALCAFAMIGYLRHECPALKIVAGGSLITSWMANPAWKDPFGGLIDLLVSGPGEETLLALEGKNGQSRFVAPNFDGLPMNDYFSPGAVLPYSASRGCYWSRCSFCPEKVEAAGFRPTPPETATADLKRLSALPDPTLIHIVDDAISPALMARLIASPPGRPWYGFARITRELADPDFCRGLKASGCVMLKLGLESGDQRLLNALEKGVDLECASRALASCKAAGIGTYVYLLFGTPQETPGAAEKTLEYVKANHQAIDFLNLAIFNLPIDCPEAENLDTRRFYEGDLSLYADFIHPDGWGRREVRAFLDRQFRKEPVIRPILLRNPPLFTSNHAPFFVMEHQR